MSTETGEIHVPGLFVHLSRNPEALRDLIMERSTRDDNGCLIIRGYGRYRGVYQKIGGRAWAHVASYVAFVGPLIPGHDVAHLCGGKDCVEPTHLKLMTRSENILGDSIRRAPRGNCAHPRERGADGKLIRCKGCNLESQRRWLQRNAVIER